MARFQKLPNPAGRDIHPLRDWDSTYEAYLIRRLFEELEAAEACPDANERSVHLQACSHYREQLDAFDRQQAVRLAAALRALRGEDGAVID